MAATKEFGVFVKEALLEPKHMRVLGQHNSIWLYLWLMSKVTHVDKKTGLGIVLGGKPFKFKEFDITSERVVRSMFEVLEANGYIKVTRAPYGHVVWITKCVKYFGRDMSKMMGFAKQFSMDFESDQNGQSLNDQNGQSPDQNGQSNKTIQLDNTKDMETEKNGEVEKEDQSLRQALQDFVAYRKELKHPIPPSTQSKILLKLRRWYPDSVPKQVAVIEQSIENGWRGLFQLKADPNPLPGRTFSPEEEAAWEEKKRLAREAPPLDLTPRQL